MNVRKMCVPVSLCASLMTAASYAADSVSPVLPAMKSADVFSLIIVIFSVVSAALTVICGKAKKA